MKRFFLSTVLSLILFVCVGQSVRAQSRVTPNSAPADPESAARSFGIEISDFYSALRDTAKSEGRHSIGFEEKGRKNASRVTFDDDQLYLYYGKNSSILEQISMEAAVTGSQKKSAARTLFSITLETVCGFYGFSQDQALTDEIFEIMLAGQSTVYEDLLFYGSTKEKNDETVLTVKIYYTGSGYDKPEETSYSASAEDAFRTIIAEFREDGVIPRTNGSFYFHEDHQDEWAQINWYQWESFDWAENFVISADITWKSASSTPNYPNAGCGFVFRAQDTSNHLFASLNMDGMVHFGGIRNGYRMNYDEFAYGTHSLKGSAQLILVVNGDKLTAYVDGSYIGQQRGAGIIDGGSLAFSIWSGTNMDYGTRCSFQNIYYYVW